MSSSNYSAINFKHIEPTVLFAYQSQLEFQEKSHQQNYLKKIPQLCISTSRSSNCYIITPHPRLPWSPIFPALDPPKDFPPTPVKNASLPSSITRHAFIMLRRTNAARPGPHAAAPWISRSAQNLPGTSVTRSSRRRMDAPKHQASISAFEGFMCPPYQRPPPKGGKSAACQALVTVASVTSPRGKAIRITAPGLDLRGAQQVSRACAPPTSFRIFAHLLRGAGQGEGRKS